MRVGHIEIQTYRKMERDRDPPFPKEKHTYRQKDRHTVRRTDRQTNKQTDRQRVKHTSILEETD